MSHIALNDTINAANGSAISQPFHRGEIRSHSASDTPESANATAMASRWVWVMVSISANDFGNCIAAASRHPRRPDTGRHPRYERRVVHQTKTSGIAQQLHNHDPPASDQTGAACHDTSAVAPGALLRQRRKSARVRRTPRVTALTLIVAPEMPRISRPTVRLSSGPRPRNCRLHES
jgi:hypothetical protein